MAIRPMDIVVWRQGRRHARHHLETGIYRIGRAQDNDVVLPSPVVSREHAKIFVHGDGVFIVDEGSENGLVARGRRVEMRQVTDGDLVCIDPFVLEFQDTERADLSRDNAQTPVADSARLVALEGKFFRTHIALPTSRVVIGKSEGTDIVIPDPMLSPNHAEITNVGGTYLVRDLGSPLGTELNGRRVREACLAHGDRIKLGSTVYWFEVVSVTNPEDEADPATAEEVTVPIIVA